MEKNGGCITKVECFCGASIENVGSIPYKENIVKQWNTRKPLQEIVDRLEETKKEINRWDSDKHYIYKEGADWMGEKAIDIVKEVGGMND